MTVKYIQKSDREGYVKLVSQNPHHADKDVGNQPHKGNRAGGQHQDELDPVAARTGRPYARISGNDPGGSAPMSAATPLPDIVLQKTAQLKREGAEPAAGNLPRKKMNRHPDSEKNFLSFRKIKPPDMELSDKNSRC